MKYKKYLYGLLSLAFLGGMSKETLAAEPTNIGNHSVQIGVVRNTEKVVKVSKQEKKKQQKTLVKTVIPGQEEVEVELDYEFAELLFNDINKIRLAHGKKELTLNEKLVPAAQTRAVEISHLWSHERPSGERWSSVSEEAFGENLMKGSGRGARSSKRVIQTWLESDSHKKIMLSDRWDSMALGVYQVDGQIFISNLFSQK